MVAILDDNVADDASDSIVENFLHNANKEFWIMDGDGDIINVDGSHLNWLESSIKSTMAEQGLMEVKIHKLPFNPGVVRQFILFMKKFSCRSYDGKHEDAVHWWHESVEDESHCGDGLFFYSEYLAIADHLKIPV